MSTKTASFNLLSRIEGPRRETLRRELAKTRAAEQSSSSGSAKPKAQAARPKLVLASGSPRRLTLLSQVGITPDALRPASIDESPRKGEMPRGVVLRLAKEKAETAREIIANDKEVADAYILAADTIVTLGRRILMKPDVLETAVASLQLLSGRTHKVMTGLCLITPDDKVRTRIVDTKVRFKHLSKKEIEAYIASREWRGKAGGYAIQGLAGCFVRRISGSYTNVVGLPLAETVNMLLGEGFPIHHTWPRAAEEEEA